MKQTHLFLATVLFSVVSVSGAPETSDSKTSASRSTEPERVRAAALNYGNNKTSTCYANHFLSQITKETNIRAHPEFQPVKLESNDIYNFPFSVMTGEGRFTLTDAQRQNMRNYLLRGGFIVASASCSSKPWIASFQTEIRRVFPDTKFEKLRVEHPVFHTVYDITYSRYTRGNAKLPHLEGLEVNGKIVLVWSPDGLNDTGNAGGNCCCCGGNEIKSAKKVNANLLAYALTH